jgi:hypothetical protein
MFAPAKNLLIDTRKNSIYMKFAPVKTKNASVTINIMDAFKFLVPCVSKFLIIISLIFLSFGLSQRKKSRSQTSIKGTMIWARKVKPRIIRRSKVFSK